MTSARAGAASARSTEAAVRVKRSCMAVPLRSAPVYRVRREGVKDGRGSKVDGCLLGEPGESGAHGLGAARRKDAAVGDDDAVEVGGEDAVGRRADGGAIGAQG